MINFFFYDKFIYKTNNKHNHVWRLFDPESDLVSYSADTRHASDAYTPT